jgi:hypothetical protein
MNHDGSNPHDFSNPASRVLALKSIPPDRQSAANERAMLLSLLEREMEYRKKDIECEYYENLYLCAFLLYLAGDPADAVLIWKAKHINMDTGFGLDGQSLVGAGVEQTVRYLEAKGENKIVDYIRRLQESGDLDVDALTDWEKAKAQYFYASA